jgi:glycosyltransferase involved in cell wall biosynthesis
MPTVQTLITTMKLESAPALLDAMNLRGHRAIIGNQCAENRVERFEEALVVSTDLRGVGQNRNNIIERADADICVLADDDMRFCDDYEEIVARVFDENPDADVVIFNFIVESEGRRVVQKKHRVTTKNYMNYGAARFAFRRKSVLYHAISFNTMFGGGTPHQCGEDSLFLRACLRAGLRVIVVPEALATLTEARESTWFEGYTDKYFHDKGVFLGIAHPRLAKPMALLLIAKHKEYREGRSFHECYKRVKAGIAYARARFRG